MSKIPLTGSNFCNRFKMPTMRESLFLLWKRKCVYKSESLAKVEQTQLLMQVYNQKHQWYSMPLLNSFHTDPVFSRQNINVVYLSDFVQFCFFFFLSKFRMKIEGKTMNDMT